MSAKGSKIVIYAAMAGNLLVAATKFLAAALTGSSVMLSEGVHSVVDTSNQALLLYGLHRAEKPPDELHPLGYGRELYFWSFVVALLIFSLGAGISFYEGVMHIMHPAMIVRPYVNYVVLGLSFLFEGASWFAAWREFGKFQGLMSVIRAAIQGRDPTSFLVLFEDSAALLGILIAAVGTLLADNLQMPVLDGIASICIGVVLAATAAFLARESKGLLIGETAQKETRRSIVNIVRQQAGVMGIGRFFTVHLAPRQIVVSMDVDFRDDLRASEVEGIVARLNEEISATHPDVIELFINPKHGTD